MEFITAMVKGEALSVVYVLILILKNTRLDAVRNIGRSRDESGLEQTCFLGTNRKCRGETRAQKTLRHRLD